MSALRAAQHQPAAFNAATHAWLPYLQWGPRSSSVSWSTHSVGPTSGHPLVSPAVHFIAAAHHLWLVVQGIGSASACEALAVEALILCMKECVILVGLEELIVRAHSWPGCLSPVSGWGGKGGGSTLCTVTCG